MHGPTCRSETQHRQLPPPNISTFICVFFSYCTSNCPRFVGFEKPQEATGICCRKFEVCPAGDDIEVWRIPSAPNVAPEPIVLGPRPWVHFGRRAQCKVDRQPDVELFTRTASRKQALLLRNFHGQVFLLDMGSSHGTYLGRQKLNKSVKEWKPGVVVFFADANTETFELRRQFNRSVNSTLKPAAKPLANSSGRGIAGIASMVLGSNFAGARRMMGSQLGEEIAVKPKVVNVEYVEGLEDDQKETCPEVDLEACEKENARNEHLYPGDWEVPADGLSKIGWKQAPEAKDEALTTASAASAVAKAPLPQADPSSLASRLEQVMLQCFGPDIIGSLRSNPRYPCPDRPKDWALNLWSGRSRPYDPTQPAIVVIKASLKPSVGLTRQVTLNWLSANLPAQSQLLVRFTDAPLELAEPADAGRWQLDLPLTETCGKTGVVSLSSCQQLPQKLFVRLCSCHGPRSGEVLPGGVFGSTLHPLDIDGDEWELSPASGTYGSQRDDLACPRAPLEAKRGVEQQVIHTAKQTSDAFSVSCSGISSRSSRSSELSPVSRVSTELPSESGEERSVHPQAASSQAKIAQAKEALHEQQGSKALKILKDQTAKGSKEAKEARGQRGKMKAKSPPRHQNQRQGAKRSRPRQSLSPIARKRSKVQSDSEDELMQLSASKLVSRMKAGIIAKRLTSPDFKHGRLRAAYSKALDLLCDEG